MHPAHQPKHLRRHPSRTRSPRFSAAFVPDPTALPRGPKRDTCASCGEELWGASEANGTCPGCVATRRDLDDGEELNFEAGR